MSLQLSVPNPGAVSEACAQWAVPAPPARPSSLQRPGLGGTKDTFNSAASPARTQQIPRFQFHFPAPLTALSWVTLKSQGRPRHCCPLPGAHHSFFPVTTCPGAAPLRHRSESPRDVAPGAPRRELPSPVTPSSRGRGGLAARRNRRPALSFSSPGGAAWGAPALLPGLHLQRDCRRRAPRPPGTCPADACSNAACSIPACALPGRAEEPEEEETGSSMLGSVVPASPGRH